MATIDPLFDSLTEPNESGSAAAAMPAGGAVRPARLRHQGGHRREPRSRQPHRRRSVMLGFTADQGTRGADPRSAASASRDSAIGRDADAANSPSLRSATEFRASIEDFPEANRFEAWREIVGRAVMKMEVEHLPGRGYRAEVMVRASTGLCMLTGMWTGIRCRRTPALVDSDDLILHVSLGGGFFLHQLGREVSVGKGDAVVISSAEPLLVDLVEEPFLVLRVPLKAVAPLVGDVGDALVRPIPNDSEALRLLVNYADFIRSTPPLATPEVRRLATTHVYDLVALTLGATREAKELADGRGLRAARLHAIKADIAEHLESADLSVETVAARQHITPRYVQRLFEQEGTTFTQFVLGQRLARAHRRLTDPRFADRSITSLAFDAGFADLSYFNRSFRRRYGAAPSDIRSEAADREGECGNGAYVLALADASLSTASRSRIAR